MTKYQFPLTSRATSLVLCMDPLNEILELLSSVSRVLHLRELRSLQESRKSGAKEGERSISRDDESKQWKCSYCSSSYTQKGKLKAHTARVHREHYERLLRIGYFRSKSTQTGKPFSCPVAGCLSGFYHRASCNRHLKQQHGMEVEDEMKAPGL